MALYESIVTGEIKEFGDRAVDSRQWVLHNPHPKPSSLTEQVGGSHYKSFVIQPFEFIQKNGLSFCEGSVIKYVCRWRQKNGVEDLKKARHYLDMLIEMEEKKC